MAITIEQLREICNSGLYDYSGPSREEFHTDKSRKMTPLEIKLWKEAQVRAVAAYPHDFYTDVLEAFEITNHPMAAKIYGMAYEDGHSGGHGEVMNCMFDLVELITKPSPRITTSYRYRCPHCLKMGLANANLGLADQEGAGHTCPQNTPKKKGEKISFMKTVAVVYTWDTNLTQEQAKEEMEKAGQRPLSSK